MRAEVYYDDLGKDIRDEDIPADMMEKAQQYHDELWEHVAELDEDLMMKYLEGEELTIKEVKAAIRKAVSQTRSFRSSAAPLTATRRSAPARCCYRVHAGSDRHPGHQGINPQTDEEDSRPSSDEAPFSALAFKIATDRSLAV